MPEIRLLHYAWNTQQWRPYISLITKKARYSSFLFLAFTCGGGKRPSFSLLMTSSFCFLGSEKIPLVEKATGQKSCDGRLEESLDRSKAKQDPDAARSVLDGNIYKGQIARGQQGQKIQLLPFYGMAGCPSHTITANMVAKRGPNVYFSERPFSQGQIFLS